MGTDYIIMNYSVKHPVSQPAFQLGGQGKVPGKAGPAGLAQGEAPGCYHGFL